jgi:hypothetical protein
MKKALIGLAVLLVVGVAVAYWQGWFKIEKTQTDEGKPGLQVTVDKEKFKQDKDKLKNAAAKKSKAWQERLAHLRDKIEGQSGEEKAKTEKEIGTLNEKQQGLDAKLKKIEDAAEEKMESAHKDLTALLDELNKDGEKEADKPN